MPAPLVECIPNFSEARRPEVVEAILAAIQAVPQIHILDRHSDLDHNRTVITFVGPPAAAEEAAYQAIAKAAELIDLDRHTGAHPRIGATDVVPFVPISEVSMAECIQMAQRLGQRVGDTLAIPVYLYEEAATRPERHNLENIRRGQYEALKEELGVIPERDPDFGPAKVGPAGATVIGARQPLIAFNVYLTTSDTAIAQKIAKAIRNSSGGMHYVKAMGVLVDGLAQVSMNLTNYRQTPIARVVELVRREAQRYGTAIHHSELVGLIPQEALTEAAVWYLQLDQFAPDQVLESRLMELMRDQAPQAEPDFMDALASASPTPGGGSAAAHTAAVAAALVSMVARLTIGKKKYENVAEEAKGILEKAEAMRLEFLQGIQEDSQAFEAVMAAFKLPKDTPEQSQVRAVAIQAATLEAARVPLAGAARMLDLQVLALDVARIGNTNAISDAGSAVTLARAALECAAFNVRINLNGLDDKAEAEKMTARISDLEARSLELEYDLREVLAERGKISF